MTDEIKNSGTLSGGNVSGGSNLNANVSASGTLSNGVINTFTKELDPTVPEYIKNLQEEKINDWDSTVNNLDIICPKNTVKGESLLIDDALDYKVFETKIEGNSYQKITTGSNLLNFNVKQTNETKVNITSNSDGTITINGQGGFTLNFEPLNLESGKTYYQKFEIVSGTVTANNTNNSIFLSFMADKWIPKGSFISYTPEEDIQKVGIWVHASAIFENAVVKIWANTDKSDFEPYTGAVPSPNPDYSQDIEVIDGVNEFNPVESYEKNGVGIIKNENGSLTIKGTVTANGSINLMNGSFFPKIGQDYNISNQLLSGTLKKQIWFWNSTDGNSSITINPDSDKTFSFDAIKELKTFSIECKKGDVFDCTVAISLIRGKTRKQYTPYKNINLILTDHENTNEKNYYINLQDNFIGKIDDIKDELVIDKKGNVSLVKKIGKVILNGSEPWVKSGNSNENFFSGVLTVGAGLYDYIKTTYSKVLCSHFSPGKLKDNESYYIYNDFGEEGIFEAFAFSLDINKVSTIEQFKEWLYNNNVTVYYVLAEPYEINLGKIDQNFITNNNINHLFLTSNLSTNIETTYALDIKKYTDKKITELTNAVISTGANL